ncbi:hypothetical protein [Myceligenerans salitolerans]|uniref:4Fe-4S Wbl-type domain-containing protein n=1 Tax=Myceligenerans salitolerans TaxID=1230528 RepID=A0ABS3IAG3_9MICO|nr:hypothetical protein [Myceligenerans salitolerans]MBO0609359.1 hypothetical protein [Myceligenerans salitolerans]
MTAARLPVGAPLPDWMRHGSCVSGPERLLPWIAEPGQASAAEVAAMARVCAGCPVRLACAVDARGESAGFWAGRERGRLEALDLLDELAASDTSDVAAPAGLVVV